MKFKRLKPYKASSPFDTIHVIRGILKDVNIFTTEDHYFHTDLNFCSTRLKISNPELSDLNFGTNGKALTQDFSLASAYGEFMERLQNDVILDIVRKYATKYFCDAHPQFKHFNDLLKKENLVLDYKYAPDEERKIYSQLDNHQKEIIQEILSGVKINIPEDKFTNRIFSWLPFYDFKTNKTKKLPIDLIQILAGSNGMCAGNTKEEALVQGICEVFERYAIKKILEENITPPTIPNEFFQDTSVLNRLLELKEKYNYSFYIKDCSLEMGLPVIGLLLIDKTNNKYHFHLGSDPSPITALERCLTETYQGSINHKKLTFKDLNITKDPFNGDEATRYKEFKKIFIDSTGKWPNHIFLKEATYKFNENNFIQGKSDKEDLLLLTKKITNLGYDLYIRDVSYLNFPSFFVYIPKISEYLVDENNILKFLSDNFPIPFKNHIKTLSDNELVKFANNLENLDISFDYKLFMCSNHDDNDINKDILASMLYYKAKDYKNAYKNLEVFISKINEDEIKDHTYYFCARDYIFWKYNNKTNEEIINNLSIIYNTELIKDVYNDLKEEQNIFQYYELPNCFNCDKCEIINNCKFFEVLKIVKQLQTKHQDNIIDQLNLKDVFSFEKNQTKF